MECQVDRCSSEKPALSFIRRRTPKWHTLRKRWTEDYALDFHLRAYSFLLCDKNESVILARFATVSETPRNLVQLLSVRCRHERTTTKKEISSAWSAVWPRAHFQFLSSWSVSLSSPYRDLTFLQETQSRFLRVSSLRNCLTAGTLSADSRMKVKTIIKAPCSCDRQTETLAPAALAVAVTSAVERYDIAKPLRGSGRVRDYFKSNYRSVGSRCGLSTSTCYTRLTASKLSVWRNVHIWVLLFWTYIKRIVNSLSGK